MGDLRHPRSALDGGPVGGVPDSDGPHRRRPTLDRAVGPMQFLPSTWRTCGPDGDGDGVGSPGHGRRCPLGRPLLCATGDLGLATGWTGAVFSYNHSVAYLNAVYLASTRIAAASHG